MRVLSLGTQHLRQLLFLWYLCFQCVHILSNWVRFTSSSTSSANFCFASVHFSLHRFFLRLGERHIQQPTAGLWWFCPTDMWSLFSFFPFSFVLRVPAPLFTAQWLRRVPYVQYLHFYKIAIDLKNKHNKSTMQLCPQLKLAQGAEGYICASSCHLSALPQWEVLFDKTTLCGETQESSKIPSSPQFSLVHRQ